MLHITNGESVAIGQTGLPGKVLTWNDVLHEGPVPGGLPLQELSEVRARFIASCGWGVYGEVRESFACRDRALAGFSDHEEIVLWFEHDLYDQLHLIQILDWFHGRELGKTRLSLINTSEYLGAMSSEQLAELYPARRPVSPAQLEVASRAWQAFRAPDPTAVERLLGEDTSALPFLGKALLRHLEQFPSASNGLSRTERQTLEVLSAGPRSFRAVFGATQAKEEAVFMGDCVFALYVRGLTECKAPLLEQAEGVIRITEAGREVLEGKQDFVRLNGIDRWLGGVHLRGAEAQWRWADGRLAPQ